MANYYAVSRSNYFKVKNPGQFIKWVESIIGLSYWEQENEIEGEPPLYAIYEEGDGGGWPSSREDAEGDGFEELDLLQELSGHLDDDYVAVLMSAGAEKLRYVTGFAEAVNSKGEVESIALHNIYKQAQESFGADMVITEAVY